MCAHICEGTFLQWAGLVLQQPPLSSAGADLHLLHNCISPEMSLEVSSCLQTKPRKVWMLRAYVGNSLADVKYRICKQGLYF